MFCRTVLPMCLLACVACTDRAATRPSPSSSAAEPETGTHVDPPRRSPTVAIAMRQVELRSAEQIVLRVATLQGEMIARGNQPPMLDDQRSFVLNVSTADLSIDMASLSHLLNDVVFAYENSPLSKVRVEAAGGGRMQLKATLHKGVPIPVSMEATPSATDDGRLRLHIESMKAAGVPAKGLLKVFGLRADDLVDLHRRRGIEMAGNDVVLTPGEIVPPPEIRGRLARAAMQGNRLSLRYAPADGRTPAALQPPDPRAAHYIYFSGGTIRFGKLIMVGADLQLIDADPRDPFDFFPARYDRQLVAGYSKNTPEKGLKTYMPDFGDVVARSSGGAPGRR